MFMRKAFWTISLVIIGTLLGMDNAATVKARQVLDPTECEYITTLNEPIDDIFWSSDGYRIIVQTVDQSELWQVWDRRFGELLDRFAAPSMPLAWRGTGAKIAWKPDATQVAIVNADNTVTIWAAEGTEPLFTLPEPAYRVAWSADGQFLASGHDDDTLGSRIYLWNADNGELRHTVERDLFHFAWRPDGSEFVVSVLPDTSSGFSNERSFLEIREGQTNELVLELALPFQYPPEELTWNSDASQIIASIMVSPAPLVVWDTSTGEARVLHKMIDIGSFAWNDLALAGVDFMTSEDIVFWNIETETEMLRMSVEEENPDQLLWSPDGEYLAASLPGGDIYVCKPMLA